MVSFEIFVKAMPPSLSELKVLPSFCFAFKIPDDRAVTNVYKPITVYGVRLAHVIIMTNFDPPKNKLHSPTDFTANQPYNAMEASASPVAKTRELFLHQQPLGTMARKFKF